MKSGTVEHGFKTNRKTFTTPMKKYAGCLTTAHRKLNRQNTQKDCIRQLQNMAVLQVERCLRQEQFKNQTVVEHSAVMKCPRDQVSKWQTIDDFPGLLEMNSPTLLKPNARSKYQKTSMVPNFALMTISFCWPTNCANELRPLHKSVFGTSEEHYDPPLHSSSKVSKFTT